MDHRTTQLRAFSLVEALVTLAIVGSLFALALPRLKPTLEQVADAQEVSHIADALRHAQRMAIDGQCLVRVFSHKGEMLRESCQRTNKAHASERLFSTSRSVDVTLLPTGRALKESTFCVNEACLRITRAGDISRESSVSARASQ